MNERQPKPTTEQREEPSEQAEVQRFKTLAVRLEESLHARLHFIAQLNETSLAEEIRNAIEERVSAAQDNPALIAKADEVRAEIEREAALRAAAIAGFLGKDAVASSVTKPTSRRQNK